MSKKRTYRKQVTDILRSTNLSRKWKIVRASRAVQLGPFQGLLQHKVDPTKFATIDGLDISELMRDSR